MTTTPRTSDPPIGMTIPLPPELASFYDVPLALPFRYAMVTTDRPVCVRLDALAVPPEPDIAELEAALHPEARAQMQRFRRDWPLIESLERYLAVGNTDMARVVAMRLVTAAPERAVAHWGLGRLALLSGDWAAAARAFADAAARAPGSFAIERERILALAASGDAPAAVARLDALGQSPECRSFRRLFGAAIRGGNPVALRERARRLGAVGSVTPGGEAMATGGEAMPSADALLTDEPDDAAIAEMAAWAAVRAGDAARARTLADRSIRLDPQAPEGWLLLVELALRAGNAPEAERAARMARHVAPDSLAALLALPRVLMTDGRPAHAADLLATIGTRWPDEPGLVALQAAALLASGARSAAADVLLAAVHRRPGDPVARFNLARVAEVAGDPDRALAAYGAARRLARRFDEAREGEAVLLGRRGDAVVARAELEAMTRDPEAAPFGWRGLGDLALAEHPAEAARCYAEALAARPDLPIAGTSHLAGLVELNAGRYEAAAAQFDAAVRLDPRHHASWCALGVARHRLGRHEPALAAMREAARLRPEEPGYQANLAAFYRAAFRRNPIANWRCLGRARAARRRANAGPDR